jgi:general secretion pathway protein K
MRGVAPARTGRRESGIALLLVVWIMTLLTVIALEFVDSTRLKARAEHNKLDDLEARALAIAGYKAAVASLNDDIKLSLDEDEKEHLLITYAGEAEGTLAEKEDVPLGAGTYSYTIRSEDGLVDLNRARRDQLGNLLQRCGVDLGVERDVVIDSIVDWRDHNSPFHEANGAEEDYYRGLDPPYSCKDGDFDVVEELQLVRGIRDNPRLFFGGEVDGKTFPGLRDLVTVFHDPAPAVGRPGGGVRLNATAPEDVREALGIQAPQPAKTPPDLSYYRITATGMTRSKVSRKLQAVVSREQNGGGSGGYEFTLLYYKD